MMGYGKEGMNHPWHQIPALAVSCVVMAPLFVVCLPIIGIEEVIGGPSIFRPGDTTVSKVLVVGPAVTCAYVAATPFFVLGLPLELTLGGDKQEAETPERSGQ